MIADRLPPEPLVARSAHPQDCPARFREYSLTDCTCGLSCGYCDKPLTDAFLVMLLDGHGNDVAICDDCFNKAADSDD